MKLHNLRTWLEVDLDTFSNNLKIIKKHIGSSVKLLTVLKANAYGHGAVELSKEAVKSGADFIAVACVDEAIELRKAGITVPVLVLSHTTLGRASDIVKYDIIPTVFNTDIPVALNEYLKSQDKKVKVHIKLDTGMTRLGFDTVDVEKTVNDIISINNLSNIEIDGVFTHFADADNENSDFTAIQFDRYLKVISELEKRGIKIPVKHACNSAAAIANKNMHLDMVRCGIIIYGYYPEKYLEKILPGLKPNLSWKSEIFQVRNLKVDSTVSYGRTYNSEKGSRIGVVPVGYADGFSRTLSNDFYVLVNGKKAPLIGRVCMDQFMIDLTGIPDAKEGDEVTIIGKDGEYEITADNFASKLGTISYEILCDIGRRVPVVYLKNKEIYSSVNYLV